MRLSEYVARYCGSRDLSAGYRCQLVTCARVFARCQGDLQLGAIDAGRLNAFLACPGHAVARETRRARRRMLLTLADAASDEGLMPGIVRRRVMKIAAGERHQALITGCI